MKPQKIKFSFLNNEKLYLFTLVIFFVVGILNVKNYGISWDEQSSRAIGFINGRYIFEVFFGNENLKNFINFFDLNFFDEFLKSEKYLFNDYAEKAYGPGFELPMAIIELLSNSNNSKEIFMLRHSVNFIIFNISLIFFYRFLKIKLNSNFHAFLGCCLLALSPRIFAHSFYNSKDIIFLSYFIIANYYGYKFFLDRKSFKNISFFSISLALTSAVRPLGLILLFFYLFLNFIKNREVITKHNFILIFSSFLFLYIFWPYLWSNPIKNFYEAFFYFSKIPWTGNVFFLNELIDANNLPFYYLPTWILITTPEIIIALLFFSSFILLKKFYTVKFKNTDLQEDILFVVFFLVIPISLNIFLKTILFDGWRHLYFIYPFIILLSLSSLKYLLKKSLIKIIEIIICINIIFLVFWNISNNPYQYLYFNKLIIGKNSIEMFEKDYWGISNKQLIEHINTIEKNKIKIKYQGSNLKTSLLILSEKDKKKFEIINKENLLDKHYVFVNNRFLSRKEINDLIVEKKFIKKIIFNNVFINGVYIENENN